MGAVEIVERIKGEVKLEQDKVLIEARAKAEAQQTEASEEMELRKQQFIEAEEEKGRETKERIVRAARLKAKKHRWDIEEELIQKALEAAMKRIPTVKSEGFKGTEYSTILASLIKEAAQSIIAGGDATSSELEVVISAEDETYVNSAMLNETSAELSAGGAEIDFALSEERMRSVGGVIVRRTDGKIVVDNTFEQRRERFSTNVREDVVKELFKDKES
ncbi:H+-ATPase subunit E [Candidatus Methanophagaceae archaeon]|nr:H+-ATPase subunit E [Methanophagales archaeon]